MASVSFQLPARAVTFIGINKAVKPSSAQFFDLFHGLLYLVITPYRNRFLVEKEVVHGTEIPIEAARSWQCATSGSKMSGGGTPDGEEYMATALIFAHTRWGDTSGKYNYATEAQWVLDLIRTKYFNSQYHIVKFVGARLLPQRNRLERGNSRPVFLHGWNGHVRDQVWRTREECRRRCLGLYMLAMLHVSGTFNLWY